MLRPTCTRRNSAPPPVSSGFEMQILDGLKEGEEVILYPGDRVKAGQRVKLIQIAQ